MFNNPVNIIAICALSLALALPAHAAGPAREVTFKGLYQCNFAGIVIAKVGIEAEQDEHGYSATGDIMLSGIARVFNKHSSHTTAEGSGKDFVYATVDYASNYKTNKKRKGALMKWRDGKLTEEKLTPPETPGKRPAIEQALKDSAIDPLSTVLLMRQKLIAAQQAGEDTFSIDTYDGKRLSRLNFTIEGARELSMYDKRFDTIAVVARRTPLGGFTASELEDFGTKEPPLTIYFSDDAKLWPLKFEAPLQFGSLTVTLLKQCRTGESCLLGNKE